MSVSDHENILNDDEEATDDSQEEISDKLVSPLASTNDLISVPSGILFPSELNLHLKEEIRYLTQENVMLKRNVTELEESFKKQQEQLIECSQNEKKLNEEIPFATDFTRAKIVELSKKLRDKTAEVLHYKTKCAKLDHSLAVMKQNEAERAECSPVEEKVEKPPESELKILNDKISSLNSKLFEEKNHVLSLKNELKMAIKILQEEIGEQFDNIQQMNNDIHWKGRAQIIAELQFKLQETRERVKLLQDKEGTKAGEAAAKKSFLECKVAKLTKENESLKSELETVTKKLENGRQKIKNLDAECNNWKNKYSNVADHLEKERAVMNTLTVSHSNSQTQLNEKLKRKDKKVDQLQSENKLLKASLSSLQCDNDNLQKVIKEKDEMMAKKISIRPLTPNQTLTSSQLDADRTRLLELNQIYAQRLQKERDEKNSIEMLYKSERLKAARLEASLTRQKLEDADKSSYTSLIARPGFEENFMYKFELAQEKIKALQTRLQIEKAEREEDIQEFSKFVQNHQ